MTLQKLQVEIKRLKEGTQYNNWFDGKLQGIKETLDAFEQSNIYQDHESCIAIDKKELQQIKEAINEK